MRLKHAIVCLVCLTVVAMWLLVLWYRLPYLDQIPVYDSGDAMTSAARMWAHNWWANGALTLQLPFLQVVVRFCAGGRSEMSVPTANAAAIHAAVTGHGAEGRSIFGRVKS
jgi:hypothetical protein